MTTKIISLNECRKNLSSLWKKAREEQITYLVTVHSKPVFEINPIFDDDPDWISYTAENHKAWEEAQKDFHNGEVYEMTKADLESEENFLYSLKEK